MKIIARAMPILKSASLNLHSSFCAAAMASQPPWWAQAKGGKGDGVSSERRALHGRTPLSLIAATSDPARVVADFLKATVAVHASATYHTNHEDSGFQCMVCVPAIRDITHAGQELACAGDECPTPAEAERSAA